MKLKSSETGKKFVDGGVYVNGRDGEQYVCKGNTLMLITDDGSRVGESIPITGGSSSDGFYELYSLGNSVKFGDKVQKKNDKHLRVLKSEFLRSYFESEGVNIKDVLKLEELNDTRQADNVTMVEKIIENKYGEVLKYVEEQLKLLK